MRRIDWNNTVQIDPDFRKEYGVVFACPLKERGGVTVRDYSGNRYDGTLTNGPTRAFDKWGGPALDFAGTTNGHVLVGQPFTPPLTFSGWFYADGGTTNNDTIIESTNTSHYAEIALMSVSGKVTGFVEPLPAGNTYISGSTTLTAGWHMLTLTLDSTLSLYADGAIETSAAANTPTGLNATYIGVRRNVDAFYSACTHKLANVICANKVWTAEQVARLYRDPYAMYWQPSHQRFFLPGSSPPTSYATYLTLLGVG